MGNREKLPCEHCGATNYLSPFSNPEGYIACNLTCYYTVRWRKRWNYLTPVEADPKYQHQKGTKRRLKCKE